MRSVFGVWHIPINFSVLSLLMHSVFTILNTHQMCYRGHYPETYLEAFEGFFFFLNTACLITFLQLQKNCLNEFLITMSIKTARWLFQAPQANKVLHMKAIQPTKSFLQTDMRQLCSHPGLISSCLCLANTTPARFGISSAVQPQPCGFQLACRLGNMYVSVTKQFA